MYHSSTSVSPSRTYIILLDKIGTFKFKQVVVPKSCENNSAIATNLFHQKYLRETPDNEAGLIVATIPVEQIQQSVMLRQLFASVQDNTIAM